jgi:hypothetical protein
MHARSVQRYGMSLRDTPNYSPVALQPIFPQTPQGIARPLKGSKGHNMTQLFSVIPMWFLVAQTVLIAALIVGQIPYGK